MRIAILRIGTVDKYILGKIQSGLERIYPETECLIYDEIMSMPVDAYSKTRQQFYSTHILAKISNYVKQTQADCILGVTAVDIYVPELNFVFGEATCPGKAAIISLFRLKPEFYGHSANHEVFIERCIKEAVHEIGHTLGLRHCQNPTCVMFFSNNIQMVDTKKSRFCERCSAKLTRYRTRRR